MNNELRKLLQEILIASTDPDMIKASKRSMDTWISLNGRMRVVLEMPQPEASAPQDMVLVSQEAVALAWSIAHERRDVATGAMYAAEQAQKDLDTLERGGFSKHLPTLDELRGILAEAPRSPQKRSYEDDPWPFPTGSRP